MSAPLFTFECIVVTTGGTIILDDITMSIPGHGITAVVGPSGSGKSTVLRLCNRLDVPTSGTVSFRGTDVGQLDPLRLRRQVGMVFQHATMLAGTVENNLRLGEPKVSQDQLMNVLTMVSLPGDLLYRDADTLSGGEAQRVSLARTLVTRPEVLLLDEPTTGLDATPTQAFEHTALELARSGLPIVWVTHDLDQLRRVADHVIVLMKGRIAHLGTPHTLTTDPSLHSFSTGSPS